MDNQDISVNDTDVTVNYCSIIKLAKWNSRQNKNIKNLFNFP